MKCPSKTLSCNLRFTAKAIRTRYWKPGDDYVKMIVDSVADECEDDDIVVISEKAISVAMGRVFDESAVRPSFLARFLARFWMRLVWGRLLGPVLRYRPRTIRQLRHYPVPEGEAHKEAALRYAGLGQALLPYSEGGIDVTNLPYALASLPLGNPEKIAGAIRNALRRVSHKRVAVMIVDTDKTFSRWGIHIAPRPIAMKGIRSMGLAALLVGRLLAWNARATPLALCGKALSVDEALEVAGAADRARGYGAGRTVWDMARRFHVGLTEVSWEMLEMIQHFPIVLVRKAGES